MSCVCVSIFHARLYINEDRPFSLLSPDPEDPKASFYQTLNPRSPQPVKHQVLFGASLALALVFGVALVSAGAGATFGFGDPLGPFLVFSKYFFAFLQQFPGG